jgi:hypothetical protein
MTRTRFSGLATGGLVFAAVVLIAGTSWAIFEGLGPSKDEWKLKYDVQVSAADGDLLNVAFTLVDEGRLKPIHSISVVAFSRPDQYGARTWDLKAPIELSPTRNGTRVGQVQIRSEFADRALIRFLTQTVDGRRVKTASAAYYDIPLKNFLK